jgi:uncharacterized membrane protein YfhO
MRKPQIKMLKTRAKNARKRAAMKTERDTAALSEQATIAKRAQAYRDMEPHVCDLARAAELAMLASDDESLFLFAVEQFETMAQRFRKRYYAEEFSGD